MHIRGARADDSEWLAEASVQVGGPRVVSLGTLRVLADYPTLIAEADRERLGFATYRLEERSAELLAIASSTQWAGVGTALLAAVESAARSAGCTSVLLCTTNDNVDALRFYQRRGYRLEALHAGEFANVRRIKGVDETGGVEGQHQIVIRDELVLKKDLKGH